MTRNATQFVSCRKWLFAVIFCLVLIAILYENRYLKIRGLYKYSVKQQTTPVTRGYSISNLENHFNSTLDINIKWQDICRELDYLCIATLADNSVICSQEETLTTRIINYENLDTIYHLDTQASYECRLHLFNSILTLIRSQQRDKRNVQTVTPQNGTAVWVVGPASYSYKILEYKYFEHLKNVSAVATLHTVWPLQPSVTWDKSNMPVSTFYPSKAFSRPCSFKDMSVDCKAILNISNIISGSRVHGIRYAPQRFPNVSEAFSTYVHIVHNAYIDDYGNVHSITINLAPAQCNVSETMKKYSYTSVNKTRKMRHLKEVFIISQQWGKGYFHGMLENVPRIAVFLDFLIANPSIKIKVATGCKYVEHLNALGIKKHRLVSGKMTTGIAYMPQGGGCGNLHQISGVVLQHKYHEYISRTRQVVRNAIVLIRRSPKGRRWLVQHYDVRNMVKHITSEFGMSFKEFRDDPSPGLNETMDMFASAVLIIAPHGAGLSNIIYSRPGTFVIEILCSPHKKGSRPNRCYGMASKSLGMIYFGLFSDLEDPCGPISIDIKYLEVLVRNIVIHIKGISD